MSNNLSDTSPRPPYGTPAWTAWIERRLKVEHAPSAWPPCDERCGVVAHDPDVFLVLGDLEVASTHARGGGWWNYHHPQELEREPEWEAVAAAKSSCPADRTLPRATRLRRLATTDDEWDCIYNPGVPVFEALYDIIDGPFRGAQLVAVVFGPSTIAKGCAGKLIVPDHPPAHDPTALTERIAMLGVP
jgi:hypothetical protein